LVRFDHHAEQDHQPAHGRRADLGEQVGLGPIGSDRLPFALARAQQVNDRGAEHQHESKRRDGRTARSHGDVTEEVEQRDFVGETSQPIEHD
jgi:hypothetical protein